MYTRDAKGNVFEEDIRLIDDTRSERPAPPAPKEVVREVSVRKSRTPQPPPPAPRRVREETNIDINLDLTARGSQTIPFRSRDPRWTEVTKDLVIREAIERRGYGYEETQDYFYIMEYLQFVGGLFACITSSY